MRPPTGHTPVYALLGRPVRHSLSPQLHNHWFDTLGIDGVYVALELPENPTADLAAVIRELGLAGVNLTVPFKQRLIAQLDGVDEAVRATGAANVVINRDGRLYGHNTDVDGFRRSLLERFGAVVAGSTCAVLGAGGAARAVVYALLCDGAQEVHVFNRTQGTALALALDVVHRGPPVVTHALTPEAFSAMAPSLDLVVNATSGGADATVDRLDVDALPDHARWVDLNYWQVDPPAMARCARRGLGTQEGRDMLVHQAALAFEHFTGQLPDASQTLKALPTGLAHPR